MTNLTTSHNDEGIKALAGKYRVKKDDGPLTDEEKALLHLIDYCREVEVNVRRRLAKNAVQIDEESAEINTNLIQ